MQSGQSGSRQVLRGPVTAVSTNNTSPNKQTGGELGSLQGFIQLQLKLDQPPQNSSDSKSHEKTQNGCYHLYIVFLSPPPHQPTGAAYYTHPPASPLTMNYTQKTPDSTPKPVSVCLDNNLPHPFLYRLAFSRSPLLSSSRLCLLRLSCAIISLKSSS